MRRVGIVFALMFLFGLTGAGAASAGTQGPTKSLGKAKGIEYRLATYPSVTSAGGAIVTCKDETFALGGGGLIDGADGLSALISSAPVDLNPDNSANDWQVLGTSAAGRDEQTYAMCSKTALGFVAGPTLFPMGVQTHTVGCPGGRVVSGGILNDDDNPVRILESTPVDSGADSDSVPDNGWRLVADNTGASNATPIILITCSPTAELTYVSRSKNVPQDALGKAIAKCPNRYAVSGGGFEAGAVGPPTGLIPWDSKDKGKVPEDGWRANVFNGSIGTLAVISTAICLKKF